jgi:uncharacterized protein
MESVVVLAILGAAAAGFVQGLSGTAFAMVALAVWAWAIPPQLAGPMAVFGSLIGQIIALRSLREGFQFRIVAPFILGGVLGVPVGVWLLPQIDQLAFKAGLGVFLVAWCATVLLAGDRAQMKAGGRVADGMIGWTGGVLGGISGLAGAVPTLWCTLRGWDRDTQRAVFQSFNLTMHILTFSAYLASGLITREVGWMFAIIAPALLVPTLIGLWLYRRVSTATFRRVIVILLLLSGFGLLGSTLPALLAR